MNPRNEREARDALEPKSESEVGIWRLGMSSVNPGSRTMCSLLEESRDRMRKTRSARWTNWLILALAVLLLAVVVDIMMLARGCA
ncbi:MAG TPA: hypothetical protein VLD59_08280 [Steroidobacteraceae bacterium]|nr:hypothetical protein [Steroidobacteraceae bacterium]